MSVLTRLIFMILISNPQSHFSGTPPELEKTDDSFKRVFKGYKEIHVPKSFAADEKELLISDIPEWAQAAFKGAENSTEHISCCVHDG
ncbi:8010_t:CDS:2 [Paraglomus occultum]|uniref:8010_t:CDS:1 n=1 Tax=Paraglomus occultum TaxID=144539 RepID=A0A9N9AIK1_9GLOM|nr:8010_t:CDS:2 [Paraglomus occultum]